MADVIKIDRLNKSYHGKPVLKELSFSIPAGRITAVMAPSGAGKTTLLRILMGLEQADSGRIEGLEGLRLSAVFQEDRLCPNLSPVSNIRLVTGSALFPPGNPCGAGSDRPFRLRLSAGPGNVRRTSAGGRPFFAPFWPPGICSFWTSPSRGWIR